MLPHRFLRLNRRLDGPAQLVLSQAIERIPRLAAATLRIEGARRSSGLCVDLKHVWAEGDVGKTRLAQLQKETATRTDVLVTVVFAAPVLDSSPQGGSATIPPAASIDVPLVTAPASPGRSLLLRGEASYVRSCAEYMYGVVIQYARTLPKWKRYCHHIPDDLDVPHLERFYELLEKMPGQTSSDRENIEGIITELQRLAKAIGLTPVTNRMLKCIRKLGSLEVHRAPTHDSTEAVVQMVSRIGAARNLAPVDIRKLMDDARVWHPLAVGAADALQKALARRQQNHNHGKRRSFRRR